MKIHFPSQERKAQTEKLFKIGFFSRNLGHSSESRKNLITL